MPEARDRATAVAWVLAAVVVLLYFPALDGQILDWDDGVWLRDPILEVGLVEAVSMAFSEARDRAWYPVLRLSWWAQRQATGETVPMMHLVNLLLFAGSIPALVTVLRRCGMSAVAALVAVALWAVHPSRVESVAWLTSRKDVLALALIVAAAHAFLPAEGARRQDALGAVLYALAVLTKVAVAPLIVVIGLAVRARENDREALKAVALPTVLGFGIAMAGIAVFQSGEGPPPRPAEGLVGNVVFAFWQLGSWTLRLGQMTGLAVVHPIPESMALGAALGVVVLGGVVGVAVWKRDDPWILTGCALALVPLLPMSGVVSMTHWAGDRHLLYPSLAVFVAIALLAERFGARYAPLVLALPFVYGTATRIPDWHDPIALWEADMSRPGEHWVRGVQLGTAYGRASRFDDAVAAYKRAEAADPGSDLVLARRLIAELAAGPQWTQAAAKASQALQPEPKTAQGWSTAAALLIDTKHFRGARDAANQAKKHGADDFGTHLVLATVATILKDEPADPHIEAAAAHSPATAEQLRTQIEAFAEKLR